MNKTICVFEIRVVYSNYSSLVKILIGSNTHVFFKIKNTYAKQLVRVLPIVNDVNIFFRFPGTRLCYYNLYGPKKIWLLCINCYEWSSPLKWIDSGVDNETQKPPRKGGSYPNWYFIVMENIILNSNSLSCTTHFFLTCLSLNIIFFVCVPCNYYFVIKMFLFLFY